MKNRHLYLAAAVVLIISAITYFESTKPKAGSEGFDSAEIEIEKIWQNNSEQIPDTAAERISRKSEKYERAKELVDPDGYINIDNISIAENIGKKIILIDFWTYSCINCQRTLPYLNGWYEKYEDAGLLIIGVHTPEFEFEKKYENVVMAAEKYNIGYPIILDNDKQTWRAYRNRYWPRKYLIDIDGFIVYDHIGEGAYDETEQKIQQLLEERNTVLMQHNEIETGMLAYESDKGESAGRTPEIYFGYRFSRGQLGNVEGWQPGEIVDYKFTGSLVQDMFYLDGSWKNNEDSMELVSSQGEIYLSYYAKNVNIVSGSENTTKIKVYLDGLKVNELNVSEFDLYNIVSGDKSSHNNLRIVAEKGLNAYTFTFG